MDWLAQIKWNTDGLVPVITQEFATQQVLTLAWMNDEALRLTVETGHAVYWSRSRQKLWHKGEESGHQQQVKSIRLDCDNDAVLLQVVQKGGIACHTGRHHCFYQQLEDGQWRTTEPVLKDPKEIYK
jgi:phosphoribosyl-AMP cyclohydrolase